MKILLQGLARRITGVVALLCLGFSVVSYWELAGLRHRAEKLHTEAEQQAADHLDGLLELESQAVRDFATSYSWWDELVTATGSANQEWMTANLDPALKDYRLEAVIVTDASDRPVYVVGLAPEVAQGLLATLDQAALRRARISWQHRAVEGGAVDLACATIHPTADTSRIGEPHGLLIGVRRWSAQRTARIARLFGGSINLDTSGIPPPPHCHDPADVHARQLLLDPAGRTIAVLAAARPMPALTALASQANTHLLLSAGFGICALLVLSLAGLLLIGRPLKLLAESVLHNDAVTARRLAQRQDELGLVALAVAQSIEQQAHLSAEVTQRRLAEESLRAVNTWLSADLEKREQTEFALREAEMRNSLALQGGNLCLWELFLADGRWATDRSWLSFLGITLDPLLPDTAAWEAVIAREGLAQLHERIAAVRAGQSTQIEVTFQAQRDDGGRVWVLLRGMVVECAGDGQPARLAGTMLDVTHWRELEEQLRQSQKLESIGQLAAGIAHEINTPIQFIGDNTRFAAESFTTLMAFATEQAALAASHPDAAVRARVAAATQATDFTYLAAEVPKAIEQTLEGVNRVATIVRAMKEFSHPGSTELTPCDLNHLIGNAVVITRNTWRYVAELSTDFAPALPLVPLAAGDFNQVLLNLIVNAAQAIEDAQNKLGKPSPGKIHLATSQVGDQAVLRISDDGCGIPEDIRARIYDPFFTTKEVGRGSGQGLTIARSVIVERHHGRLECASTVGVGTTFTITLPLTLPPTRPEAKG